MKNNMYKKTYNSIKKKKKIASFGCTYKKK